MREIGGQDQTGTFDWLVIARRKGYEQGETFIDDGSPITVNTPLPFAASSSYELPAELIDTSLIPTPTPSESPLPSETPAASESPTPTPEITPESTPDVNIEPSPTPSDTILSNQEVSDADAAPENAAPSTSELP